MVVGEKRLLGRGKAEAVMEGRVRRGEVGRREVRNGLKIWYS